MEIAETDTNNKLWSQPPEKVFRVESRCGQREWRGAEKEGEEEEEEKGERDLVSLNSSLYFLTPARSFATPVLLLCILRIPSNIQRMLPLHK